MPGAFNRGTHWARHSSPLPSTLSSRIPAASRTHPILAASNFPSFSWIMIYALILGFRRIGLEVNLDKTEVIPTCTASQSLGRVIPRGVAGSAPPVSNYWVLRSALWPGANLLVRRVPKARALLLSVPPMLTSALPSAASLGPRAQTMIGAWPHSASPVVASEACHRTRTRGAHRQCLGVSTLAPSFGPPSRSGRRQPFSCN